MGRFTETSRTVPARFTSIGTKIAGTVLSITDAPVPDFVDGRVVGPKFDVNGTVVEQTDVLLDVSGVKTLVHTGGGIAFAIASALQENGADDLYVGDNLSIEYTADEEIGGGLTPAKVFVVTISKSKAK